MKYELFAPTLLLAVFVLVPVAESQEYGFFEIENEIPNATYGWDFFNGDYAGPHDNTLDDTGATLSVFPPGGFVSSTSNLYAFETLPAYTFTLQNLCTDQPVLNVAIQVATSDPLMTAIDFSPAPSGFEDLGVRSQIGEFDIYYYWVEYNGLPAMEEFEVTMTGFTIHVTFAGARASYYNTLEPLDITFGETALLGDVNCDGAVNLLDVGPFVEAVSSGEFDAKADMNADGSVDLLDVGPFVTVLGG